MCRAGYLYIYIYIYVFKFKRRKMTWQSVVDLLISLWSWCSCSVLIQMMFLQGRIFKITRIGTSLDMSMKLIVYLPTELQRFDSCKTAAIVPRKHKLYKMLSWLIDSKICLLHTMTIPRHGNIVEILQMVENTLRILNHLTYV